ncbi:MAG: hypothetical protein L0387_16105 [Acidobacteria bacterium]|nr:hypothetical protein [Acidobacteriota bacterium]MCI0720928.1 hypothetical protein [Acidobacteriota bacterium]
MIANATALKRDPDLGDASMVNYLGLLVELIDAMEHCSLIRYRGQELVVETADFQSVPSAAA